MIDQFLRINGITFRLRHLRAIFQDHALGEELFKRLIALDQVEITQHFVEEARIQKMQDGMLDATDIEIDGKPIVGIFVEHRIIGESACESSVVPARFHESIKGIRLTFRRAPRVRVNDIKEITTAR